MKAKIDGFSVESVATRFTYFDPMAYKNTKADIFGFDPGV